MAGEKPHSVAHSLDDGRLRAPSAARNIAPILEAIAPFVPKRGVALELASGSGEHIVALAEAHPEVVWQPSDIEPDRLVSIDAWRAERGVRNMRLAQFLDASAPTWQVDPMALVVTVNLLHLVDEITARAVIAGVARNLAPGAHWFLYGPFRSGGKFRSYGDVDFHTALTTHDPAIGYKDVEAVQGWAAEAGLTRAALIEMPANNLALVLRKGAGA